MALRLVEGFEGLGTSTSDDVTPSMQQLSANCGAGPFYLDTGRAGGFSIRANTIGQDQWIGLPVPASTSTFYLGWAMKTTTGTSGVALFYFYGAAGVQGSLRWNTATSGEFSYYNYQGSVLGTSSGAGMAPAGNVWKYIELKIVVGTGTSGSVQLRVNGVVKLTVSNINTSNTADTLCTWINISANSQYRLDDFYVCDASGSSNNTYLGPQSVVALFPASDGDTLDFAASSGSTIHYNKVNERRPDGDQTYVEAGASGNIDLFHYDQLSNMDAIAGIMVVTNCRQTTGTSQSIKHVVKSGSTVSADAGEAVGSMAYFGGFFRCVELDPATSAAWTRDGLNAAEIGVEVS